jgi:hypothetical protein
MTCPNVHHFLCQIAPPQNLKNSLSSPFGKRTRLDLFGTIATMMNQDTKILFENDQESFD